ncbi:hypothetical protein CEXT_563201 [Caerostris extrusa]|uniref:Uncharacterized protein n=1 Tax=Caerostris extrusa TaxID=172846 RepID=A0AAV4MZ15_CAEEX|nr:hypothetical protein CEXT_563201 [Caerostris extrusa]
MYELRFILKSNGITTELWMCPLMLCTNKGYKYPLLNILIDIVTVFYPRTPSCSETVFEGKPTDIFSKNYQTEYVDLTPNARTERIYESLGDCKEYTYEKCHSQDSLSFKSECPQSPPHTVYCDQMTRGPRHCNLSSSRKSFPSRISRKTVAASEFFFFLLSHSLGCCDDCRSLAQRCRLPANVQARPPVSITLHPPDEYLSCISACHLSVTIVSDII